MKQSYTGPAWVTPLFCVMVGGIVMVKILAAVMDHEVVWDALETL